MNRWLAVATALASVLCGIHIVGGGVTVHQPLLATQSNAELGAYVSVLWHGVTAALLLIAVALGVATIAPPHRPALSWVAIALCLAFAAVFIGYGLTRLNSLFIMPQWTAFLLIGGLALIGVTRRGQIAP